MRIPESPPKSISAFRAERLPGYSVWSQRVSGAAGRARSSVNDLVALDLHPGARNGRNVRSARGTGPPARLGRSIDASSTSTEQRSTASDGVRLIEQTFSTRHVIEQSFSTLHGGPAWSEADVVSQIVPLNKPRRC